LSADVAELSDESKDHIILLVNWSLANLVAELVDSGGLNVGALQVALSNFRKFGKGKENSDGNTGA
jgi:histidine ammonia-lyase